MGDKDIPAEIDYVLNATGQPNLQYIGFSMGTTMFWTMTSLHPEYNSKVRLMVALAPVVYINNMMGFPRLFAPFHRIVKVRKYYIIFNTHPLNWV
jgi:lysosomal acid lipase/cholesteryl ester hydrolase